MSTGMPAFSRSRLSERLSGPAMPYLAIQAHGDLEAARAWVAKYGVAGPESLSDKRVLENAGIPVDLRFTYE